MSEPVESSAPGDAEMAVVPDAMDAAPPVALTCGAQLKAARERQGLTPADVAQRLKYAARQVQALEEGNYGIMPGLTFQRGFVRGYAKLVGLNPDALVAALELEVGQDSGPTTTQLQQIAYAPAALPARTEGMTAWPWILGMLLAIVGIGGYTLYKWEAPSRYVQPARTAAEQQTILPPVAPGEPANAAAPAAGSTAPAAEPASALAGERMIPMPQPGIQVVRPALSGAVRDAEALAGSVPAQSPLPVLQPGQSTPGSPGGGRIHLRFVGESWVEVRAGNGTLAYSGVNRAGAEQWVDGQPPFDLVIGNARAVKLIYRGAPVNLEPYTKVTVARLQLK